MARGPIAFALLSTVVACSALFGDTAQCKTDADCALFGGGYVCGGEGTCVPRRASTSDAGDSGASVPDAAADAPSAGVLATIVVSPVFPSVAAGATQQFTATGKDANGDPPSTPPSFTWTVSSGGTISPAGLFTAAATPGGPFTVTAASGPITGTTNVTVTAKTTTTVTMGETAVLANDDSGNANILLAQQATLAQDATLQSLSFYVATAAGMLRLGVYDATGPGGGPGAKKAETAEVAAAAGWNAVKVVTPVLLPKGTYWLAYAPSSNDLHFNLSDDGQGMLAYFNQTYGPMPATFSTTPTLQNRHWSFYATLTH